MTKRQFKLFIDSVFLLTIIYLAVKGLLVDFGIDTFTQSQVTTLAWTNSVVSVFVVWYALVCPMFKEEEKSDLNTT